MSLVKRLAPVVALTSALLYIALPHHLFGYETTRWNVLRRTLFPALDTLKREYTSGYAMYPLHEDELAGTTDASPRHVGMKLEQAGYTRMPLSALKKDHTGTLVERASWSKRDSLFAPWQTHVMLFQREDGKTLVYAHHERNAYSPRHAYDHYRGVGMDFDTGKRIARSDLAAL